MNKVLLIIQREYVTRVRKKAFIFTLFLVPALILLMFGIVYLIATYSSEMNKDRTVYVMDESGIFKDKFHNRNQVIFKPATKSLTQEKDSLRKNEDDFLLVISTNYAKPDSVQLFSQKKPNVAISGEIESQMNDIATGTTMIRQGIDTAKLHAIKSDISIAAKQITAKGEEDSSIGAAYGAGIACAILIYVSLLIYGSQVMRGIIEEKTSRIIEVIVSSVKPFQLMLGKIIGVGLVGLTQFVLWIVLSIGVTTISSNFLLKDKMPTVQKEQLKANQPVKVQTQPVAPQSPALEAYNSMKTVNFPYILSCFLFYFLSGFFLYSALFAAVGSAVDNETETQQFMFPITMPLLFTYILSFAFLINNPDSSLAFWLSIIPFTAPVAMMVRIPFGVPGWQLALSMFLMIGGFFFTTYIASRIYRVGILMYGKKPSYKEMAKWFFYKE